MPQNWQNVSVTLEYRDQISRNTSKIIPWLFNLVFSVCRDHNIMDLLQRERHEISAETGIRRMTCYILNIDSHVFYLLRSALQIQIRTARFLQAFTATENSLCLLFHDNAVKQLCGMFRKHNVHTANQFANAVYGEFTVVDQWFTTALVKFGTSYS